MALNLDDYNRPTAATQLSDSLVHSYIKKCFMNYDIAEQTLLNKVLLPGEVAFAYYYDELSPSGQSAIAAVGPLTHGSCNIIFKNSVTIDAIRDRLMSTITDVNSSINYLREELLESINKALNHLDSSLNDAMEEFAGASNTYQIQINNISTNIVKGDTSIMNVVNSSYNKLSAQVSDNYNTLNKLIRDISNGLYDKIEEGDTSIIKYINEKLTEGFDSNSANTSDLIDKNNNSLNDSIIRFKDAINNKIDNVSSLLTAKIGNLHVDVSNLQIDVNTNRNLYYNLEHKYKHLFDTSAVEEFVNNKQSSLQDLIEKADSKLSGLQDLIEETDSKLSGLQDYETRISNVEDRISDISSYASADTIHNIETNISSLLEEVENIKQRLNHIDEIKDSSNLPNNTI